MAADSRTEPKEGESLGPYLLRKRLSSSILGTFFLASQGSAKETALVHVLPQSLLQHDAKFKERYTELVSRQKQWLPGAALPAQEVSQIGDRLVVRYPRGYYTSLNESLQDGAQPLPPEKVRDHLEAIANGLMEAAKTHQGHFFMSPDFLFLDDKEELRIAGIGVFQSLQYESFERIVSATVVPISADRSRRFSSLEILSPEIRNFKTRDLRSDFYCIGMCAYFMLTGRKPERRWSLPSELRPDVSKGWDLLISHCLEPKPADRFPHYRAFLKDLESVDELTGVPRREGGRLLRILSRIPLPRSLERRFGLQTRVALRLSLLAFAGLLAVGTAYLFQQILISELEPQEGPRLIRRVLDESQANFILEVFPEEAFVIITGPERGRFLLRGEPLMLDGARGAYQVQVMAPQRRTRMFRVSLNGDKPVLRQVQLRYNFIPVRIEGAVGTEVYVEDSGGLRLFLGTIEEPEGLALDSRLLADTYTFLALHEQYQAARLGPVECGPESATIEFQQEARPTSLVVTTRPPGATVRVDGQLMGTSPLRVSGLPAGESLRLRIEQEGYRPLEQVLELSIGQSLSLEGLELEPEVGSLRLQLESRSTRLPPAGEWSFFIDGEKRPWRPEVDLILPRGEHTLRFEHPQFFPSELTVSIRDRALEERTLVLQPRPFQLVPRFPAGKPATFRINGQPASPGSDGILELPADRSVEVEAAVRDFLKVTQTFQGGANEQREWTIPLKPIEGPDPGEDWSPPYFDIPMVWLEPGRFSMGSPITENRRLPNEDSRTAVRLSRGFWVGAREITQEVYQQVTGGNPSQFTGESHPVDSVSWEDALAFCRRLTEFERAAERLPEGYVYRLPTEAEWEYAARAGTSTAFSFGDQADPGKGNFQGSYTPEATVGQSPEDHYGTLPVASFIPNPWGLFDVHGNVAEWTLDRFWDRHPGGSVTDPYNPDQGRGQAIRGGSWEDSAHRARSASREAAPASSARGSIGFRIVLAPDLTGAEP